MLYEKKKCLATVAFHNVCKYSFFIESCWESQESARVSESFREVSNMLAFSSLLLKVTDDSRENNIEIILIYLYF